MAVESVHLYQKVIKVFNSDVKHFILKAAIFAQGMWQVEQLGALILLGDLKELG